MAGLGAPLGVRLAALREDLREGRSHLHTAQRLAPGANIPAPREAGLHRDVKPALGALAPRGGAVGGAGDQPKRVAAEAPRLRGARFVAAVSPSGREPEARRTPPCYAGAVTPTRRRLAALLPALATPAALLAACATRPDGHEAGGGGLSCVPYARARSGIALRGDAGDWWQEAAGRYPRSREPARGAVLVFARTGRLPRGHLAVVARVVSRREIRVDHANWAPEGSGGRGRVALDQPVRDVSAAGDWSLVRVWYSRLGELGATVFPTQGFVLPGPVVAAAERRW